MKNKNYINHDDQMSEFEFKYGYSTENSNLIRTGLRGSLHCKKCHMNISLVNIKKHKCNKLRLKIVAHKNFNCSCNEIKRKMKTTLKIIFAIIIIAVAVVFIKVIL